MYSIVLVVRGKIFLPKLVGAGHQRGPKASRSPSLILTPLRGMAGGIGRSLISRRMLLKLRKGRVPIRQSYPLALLRAGRISVSRDTAGPVHRRGTSRIGISLPFTL